MIVLSGMLSAEQIAVARELGACDQLVKGQFTRPSNREPASPGICSPAPAAGNAPPHKVSSRRPNQRGG